jgi:hypothetical protein
MYATGRRVANPLGKPRRRQEECPKPQANLRLDGVGAAIEAGPVAVALFSEQTALRYRDQPPWKAARCSGSSARINRGK